MGGLHGDAGAIHVATLAGDAVRAGTPQAATVDGGRRPGQRGFTLLELLITLSVTTIGLIGLLSLHLSIARGNDGASRSAEAQQITATRLESLRALHLDDLMLLFTGSKTGSYPTPTKTWLVQGRNTLTYNVTAWVDSLPAASPNLMKIRVETTWTEDGGALGVNPALDHKLALEVIRTKEDAP
jgi:prepilin-type N-terminal cleavage/methylation domain-containing protein